jgi:3'-5' exoribonuclease
VPQSVRWPCHLAAVLVRDLQHGFDLDQVLLVREADRRQRRDGGEFLKLVLGDRTGGVPAMVWDDIAQALELCRAGSPVHVVGRYEVHQRWGAQITILKLRPALAGTYDPAELHDGPPRRVDHMEADFRELLATVQDPHLRRLLDTFFGEGSETWALYRIAPAAKRYHQAYLHGLLEHCLTVAQAVSAISATFPGIDRDVAVTGALLHDIGKLEAYTDDPQNIDLTDAGRLLGEIPLGYYRIRRAIEDIEGFPAELAQAVGHIILSHHGTLEHGSPVVPCTREATLVHMIDNLGGRLGSFDRIEKELAPGACWSGFDRAIGGSAFFAERAAEADADAGASRRQREQSAPERAPLEAEPADLSPSAAEVGAQIALTDEPAREAA